MRTSSSDQLLVVRDLAVTFKSRSRVAEAVRGIDLDLGHGETVGLVGESGSGKSVTALAIMGLLPPSATITGSIRFKGQELVGLSQAKLRALRGSEMAMVFQDPMSSLNPVLTVGAQVTEALDIHQKNLTPRAARLRAVELLEMVSVPDAARRVDSYPFQLSGGMRQRVMLAVAMANEPHLLIADEATTALDVTIQAQVLDLVRELQRRTGVGVLLITHDLGVVAGLVENVVVMYAGRVAERGSVLGVFEGSTHPYTRGLMACLPRLDRSRVELVPIAGNPPSATSIPTGCAFHPRCAMSAAICETEVPLLIDRGPTASACHFADALAGTPVAEPGR